jgi:hypothetical protein
VTPVVWVGGSCGVVTDALPGTMQGDESECDYCSDGCVQVAAEASEYEVDDPDECDELSDADDERVMAHDTYDRADRECRPLSSFGPKQLTLHKQWQTPEIPE